MKIVSIACVLLFASAAWADQITMNDGDRITGEIVKKDGDTLTVKSKNFGIVTLKWTDVAAVKSDNPINVSLTGGKTVKANIETRNGRIEVGAPGAPQTVNPTEVVALRNDAEQRTYERFLHPRLLDLWTVAGSLNIAGARGNARTFILTTPINLVRASSTSRTTAYFNAIRSSATINGVSSDTANAVRGGWAYNRNLTKKIFANIFNDYEHDQFQALDLRVVFGGGAGYSVWSRETSALSVVGGIDWNHESFSSTGSSAALTRSSAEFYWGDDFNYKLNSRVSLIEAFRMFNNLSNSGEYRMNADLGATTQLTKWLNWNIALSDRYLSNPVPGRRKSDFLYSTGLGFSWSR